MGRKTRSDRKYGWRSRTLAIFMGLFPFLALEILLRAAGIPTLKPPADPFVDLHNLRPLFSLNPTSRKLEISQERMQLFRPAELDATKPPSTFRVFALGGSTTQGEPYSTETAFPEFLRLNLQAAVGSDIKVEVINCGGLSYASYRVLAILREILNYDPDLIVLYTGHNEFLEHRTYVDFREPTLKNRLISQLVNLRTVQLARSFVGTPQSVRSESRPSGEEQQQQTRLKSEVDALLDYQGGLADYQRGDAWFEPIPAHFRWNLEQMIVACRAKVPLILIKPVANLLDCPPMKYEVDPKLSTDEQQAFENHWALARDPATDAESRAQNLELALTIDPEHAGANYLLGMQQADADQWEQARESFRRAKDFDVCPLRAPTSIAESITELAEKNGLPLLDAEALFSDRSEHGIVGNRWLVDHIHPNLDGHLLLGEEIAQLCIKHAIIAEPAEDWETRRAALYEAHLRSLSEAYFQRGKQRLAGLLLWTQGRAKKIREHQEHQSTP